MDAIFIDLARGIGPAIGLITIVVDTVAVVVAELSIEFVELEKISKIGGVIAVLETTVAAETIGSGGDGVVLVALKVVGIAEADGAEEPVA